MAGKSEMSDHTLIYIYKQETPAIFTGFISFPDNFKQNSNNLIIM